MRNSVLLSLLLCAAPLARGQTAAEHIALGDSLQAAFDPAAALKHYEAAVAADSTNAEALRKASRSAVDVGEAETDAARRKELYRLGENYARRSVKIDPGSAEAHFDLARALGRTALTMGVRDRVRYANEIREQALEALKIDANHPGALHVLGVWNAEIMRLNGFERFFARNFLGGKIFGQASWKEAVSNLERAVEVDPERLVHRLDLAEIYADIGEKAKAREQFERVVNATTRTDVNDPRYKAQAEAALKRLR
jgi:tetratricopeptide (TPR) repeat protein